jgi:CheY-like chemotaxis protein
MSVNKAKLLVVDDEPAIRTSLSLILSEIGYGVRSADDGLSALFEIELEIPDIILSDLNMPCMSGFQLLSEIRRSFPSVRTIAMSGAFCGDEVPSGVVADAFYAKGSGIGALLKIVERLHLAERTIPSQTCAPSPGWIHRSLPDSAENSTVANAFPERQRRLSRTVDGSI